jgi:hypothetical protein
MNDLFALRRLLHSFGISALLLVAISSQSDAQLAGTFRSAPGTQATYVYHHGEYESVMLPADITVTFSGDNPTSMLATIHQPIIGDIPGDDDYPIVNYFPLVVTGSSSDGRDFEGELLANSQYFFDWQFEPLNDGELKWNGVVSWVGGRIEVSTITDARLLPGVAGDYNGNGTVDAADYVVWRNTLGQTGNGLPADGDGSETIDAGDYEVWKARFGQTAAISVSAAGGVPEPATSLIAMIALIWRLLQRRNAI